MELKLGDVQTTELIPLEVKANCDGTTNITDVILIMQILANPNKYGENGAEVVHLTAQGKENADMEDNGLTVGDAQKIQMKLLGIELSISYSKAESSALAELFCFLHILTLFSEWRSIELAWKKKLTPQ